MKKRLIKGAWAASVVAALAVPSIPAEAAEMSVTIPFSFIVNSKSLPPGTYSFSSERSVLLVRDSRGGEAVLTIRLESRKDTDAKLVFHKYGDQYVLRQAWTGGGGGREIPQSPMERELIEQRRGVATAFERVSVPAL